MLFTDKKFEIYIREILEINDKPIEESDLRRITYLHLADKEYDDISPIRFCTNLQRITLPNNMQSKVDLTLLGAVHNKLRIDIINPTDKDIELISQNLNVDKLTVIFAGNGEFCNFNCVKELNALQIINVTGKKIPKQCYSEIGNCEIVIKE